MNVQELMSFTPSRDPRQASSSLSERSRQKEAYAASTPRHAPVDSYAVKSTPLINSKKLRLDSSSSVNNVPSQGAHNGTSTAPTLTEEERLAVLNQLVDQQPEQPMDVNRLRQLATNLEKCMAKNQELRVRYAGQPEKFVVSECDLNDALVDLHAIAASPDLYGEFIRLGLLHNIVQLLSHENADIACAVADLLQELTDIDPGQDENRSSAVLLVEQLKRNHAINALVQLLHRLNEEVAEESRAVHNILAIFENIANLRPDEDDDDATSVSNGDSNAADATYSAVLIDTGMLTWLLKRLKVATFDANKLYASEVLSIYLQNSDAVKKRFGDNMEVCLRQLSLYRKVDPTSTEEYEYFENLFNILCSSQMLRTNVRLAVDAEAIQLMLIMVRNRKAGRGGALKVLDYLLTMDNSLVANDDAGRVSRVFIDVLGFSAIFPLFLKPPKQYNRRTATQREMEEWATSIVCSLVRNTPLAGDYRKRLMAKFAENECEKIDRLLELHRKYALRVGAAESELEEAVRLLGRDSDAEQLRDELYLRRLDAGLFMLQRLTIALLMIFAEAGREAAKHLSFLLKMHQLHASFKCVVDEYVDNLGGDMNADAKERERQELHRLCTLLLESDQHRVAASSTVPPRSILKK